MVKAFWLVLIDLYHFVLGRESTVARSQPLHIAPTTPVASFTMAPVAPARQLLQTVQSPVLLPPVATKPPETSSDNTTEHFLTGVHYVAEVHTPLMRSPYQEFDGVLGFLRYGSTVTIESYSGRYARVLSIIGAGWVQKDALVVDRTDVFPVFVAGEQYAADHIVTRQIRLHINDAFNASELVLPLQAVEYIAYRLLCDNRTIAWPAERPRVPGKWQSILKGQSGIHIGIQPLSDSIMEYFNDEGEGVLAYVERVTPDNNIVCTAVGRTEAGVYDSLLLTEAAWRELRPVFIEIL